MLRFSVWRLCGDLQFPAKITLALNLARFMLKRGAESHLNSLLKLFAPALLFGCAQQQIAPTDAGSDVEPVEAGVCEDAGGAPGANCPCDPKTYQPTSCYSGPLGTSSKGVCKSGTRTCSPVTWTLSACNGEVVPKPETCNLLDDDCNGTVDDVPEILEAGTIGNCNSPACTGKLADAGIQCFSADLGICGAGNLVCGAGGKVTCQPFVKLGATEICNGVDDDCNGIVDDGIDNLGTCDADASGQCANSNYVCGDGGLVCPPSAPSTETCDGIDNDCNGVVDDHACAGQKTAVYCCQSSSSSTYGCTATPTDGFHKNCHAAL